MHQVPSVFFGTFDTRAFIDLLNLRLSDFKTDLSIQILSTGFPSALIAVSSLAALESIVPNFERIKEIQRSRTMLLYAFALEANNGTFAYTRMFDPLDGINEESATGTASGALLSYLFRHGLVSDSSQLVFEQGRALDRPSDIIGRLVVHHGKITEVIIGGTAVIINQKDISIA